ncbi:MAG: PilW family protein [Proteobacteria bacterium]|nr:PilW family protein [Pseudomonadota bacterium]
MKKINNTNNGFSLVEILVSMFIGIILTLGLISIFDTSSRLSRTQNGLATMQENGRYATRLMKNEIQQAAYSYCIGEVVDGITAPGQMNPKTPWLIRTANFLPGLPVGGVGDFFDPSYLVHGHECNGGACMPALNVPGTGADVGIPAVGTGDGDRVAGTDVLTIRYVRGAGREVAMITDTPPFTITFTDYAVANETPPGLSPTGQVIVFNCDDRPPVVADYTANSATTMVTSEAVGTVSSLTRAFDLQTDFVTITYYVANDIIDGRSIATLYSRINGVVNPIIQGVDDFDVLYGVKNDIAANVIYKDASDVGATPCSTAPMVNDNLIPNPAPNCGWRSVSSIEIHLLLNTVYNSTTHENEEFRYSMYGDAQYTQADLTGGLPAYAMIRKEFFTAIALKNIVY